MKDIPPVQFNKTPIAKIDQTLLNKLESDLHSSNVNSIRYCLHHNLEDAVHEMIILQKRGMYIRPHKHENETESFLVLRGRMLVILFDNNGNSTEHFVMSDNASKHCFICRLERNIWHMMIPLSNTVTFLETTQGPFKGPAHNTYASWSPAQHDEPAITQYMKQFDPIINASL